MATESSPASSRPADVRHIVAALLPCLSIVHQLPGRVRLKLDAAALADGGLIPFLADLDACLGTVRGVRNVRVNRIARSCVIDYDAGLIADQAWPDLLGRRDTPAAAALAALLQEDWGGARR